MLEEKVPRLVDVVVFGSKCAVYRDAGKDSLRRRSEVGITVGKNDETKGYKVYLPKDKVVITTRHVQDVETLSAESNQQLKAALEGDAADDLEDLARRRQAERRAKDRRCKPRLTDVPTDGDGIDAPVSRGSTDVTAEGDDSSRTTNSERSRPRRSHRAKRKSAKRREADDAATSSIALVLAAFENTNLKESSEYAHLPDPKSYGEAMRSPDKEMWCKAQDEELHSLVENHTWTVVPDSSQIKKLHTKWVYKKKRNAEGGIERYKARMVACDNEQVLGRDYMLVFAAVMDMVSAKFVLAVAAIWKVPARHFDVPSAYVKATVEDEYDIFLHVPQGMTISRDVLDKLGIKDASGVVLRLERSLYGLKQAGRLWHEHLKAKLFELGFTQSLTDSCNFVDQNESGITLVGVYVDDRLATATDPTRLDKFHANMSSLELKDLGNAEKILGMSIHYDIASGYTLCQGPIIRDLLVKFKLDKANSVRAPIGPEEPVCSENDQLLPESGPGTPERPTIKSFRSLVGSLLWVARCTRPDIAYAVHRAARRAHAPTVSDLKIARRTLRYLAGTIDLKLTMKPTTYDDELIRIEIITDADYAGDRHDRKSVSGMIAKVNGMIVAWQTKKQGAVALSTAEAKFVAAASDAKEILGVRQLCAEIGFDVQLPMIMSMDNYQASGQRDQQRPGQARRY